ncbi:hypothetical protein [Photorhabdus australis]|uniref:hypothetical protein n=1 Tax=Photorhabdus australis TaxID=286156 RepID=UPI0030DC7C08
MAVYTTVFTISQLLGPSIIVLMASFRAGEPLIQFDQVDTRGCGIIFGFDNGSV